MQSPSLSTLAALVLTAALLPSAGAATIEVKMLNRGPHAAMAYEPEFVRVAPGDTVKFLATSSGHNAATITGMTPTNAQPFKGKINEEIAVTLTEAGLYGIECLPHYAMGMVMLIQVGEVPLSNLHIPADVPEAAKQRFQAIVDRALNAQ